MVANLLSWNVSLEVCRTWPAPPTNRREHREQSPTKSSCESAREGSGPVVRAAEQRHQGEFLTVRVFRWGTVGSNKNGGICGGISMYLQNAIYLQSIVYSVCKEVPPATLTVPSSCRKWDWTPQHRGGGQFISFRADSGSKVSRDILVPGSARPARFCISSTVHPGQALLSPVSPDVILPIGTPTPRQSAPAQVR